MQQLRSATRALNPAGLHPRVLDALLNEKRLQKLVYISCNMDSLVANCDVLCSTSVGDFWPQKAACVDLFPHTSHFEVIMLLERVGVVK